MLRHVHSCCHEQAPRKDAAAAGIPDLDQARGCGDRGWLAYDSYFCHQVMGDDKVDWLVLWRPLHIAVPLVEGIE